ncbi:MAG: hypothetical protein MRJ96_16285 [Nitrospirales bacterium]|nr:hypothetical protein [Nitrospira sp.]MDR4503002.1 hypothetical protein [Nitrospirales bacterium]
MERRVTSHTEEEEMNQRRRLLGLARKGDEKAIDLLFELYQVKVYTGETLKKSKTSFSKDPQPLNAEKKSSPKTKKSPETQSKSSGSEARPKMVSSSLSNKAMKKPQSRKVEEDTRSAKKNAPDKAVRSSRKVVSPKAQTQKHTAKSKKAGKTQPAVKPVLSKPKKTLKKGNVKKSRP